MLYALIMLVMFHGRIDIYVVDHGLTIDDCRAQLAISTSDYSCVAERN